MTTETLTDPPRPRQRTKTYYGTCTVCTFKYVRYAAYVTKAGYRSRQFCAACALHALGWKANSENMITTKDDTDSVTEE